jgi:hypothetical protein
MDKLVPNIVKRFREAEEQAAITRPSPAAITRPTPASEEVEAVAPPGWEDTVKKMKKHKEIDNPWALAWHMKNKGDTPHK